MRWVAFIRLMRRTRPRSWKEEEKRCRVKDEVHHCEQVSPAVASRLCARHSADGMSRSSGPAASRHRQQITKREDAKERAQKGQGTVTTLEMFAAYIDISRCPSRSLIQARFHFVVEFPRLRLVSPTLLRCRSIFSRVPRRLSRTGLVSATAPPVHGFLAGFVLSVFFFPAVISPANWELSGCSRPAARGANHERSAGGCR